MMQVTESRPEWATAKGIQHPSDRAARCLALPTGKRWLARLTVHRRALPKRKEADSGKSASEADWADPIREIARPVAAVPDPSTSLNRSVFSGARCRCLVPSDSRG